MAEFMQTKDKLSISIKRKKRQLYNLSEHKELTDTEVVKCSQELDQLIINYQKDSY